MHSFMSTLKESSTFWDSPLSSKSQVASDGSHRTPEMYKCWSTSLEVSLTVENTAESSARSLLKNPGQISPSDLRFLIYKIKGIHLGSLTGNDP